MPCEQEPPLIASEEWHFSLGMYPDIPTLIIILQWPFPRKYSWKNQFNVGNYFCRDAANLGTKLSVVEWVSTKLLKHDLAVKRCPYGSLPLWISWDLHWQRMLHLTTNSYRCFPLWPHNNLGVRLGPECLLSTLVCTLQKCAWLRAQWRMKSSPLSSWSPVTRASHPRGKFLCFFSNSTTRGGISPNFCKGSICGARAPWVLFFACLFCRWHIYYSEVKYRSQ